jgi:transposase
VIDLLPDRTAQTLKAWLKAHPGIEFVARDRSSEYASAIQDACPDAVQVTDRWHLLANLRQLAERYLSTIYSQLEPLSVSPDQAHLFAHHRPVFRRTQSDKVRSTASRKQQEAIYHRIQALRQQGYSIRKIARLLAMHRATVTKYYQAASFPARRKNRQSRSILEPYLPYLRKRQLEGCENAMQLWREIVQQGYPGSHRQVQRWLQQHRLRPAPNTPKQYLKNQPVKKPSRLKLPAIRELSWLIVKDRSNLSAREQIILEHVLQHPTMNQVYELIQQFGRMVHNRQVEQFQTWLDAMIYSSIPLFVNFAKTLEQDRAAVEAALTYSWSNGQTEGQVNRLKVIKRQMYGRARFDLLRLRVLYSASST